MTPAVIDTVTGDTVTGDTAADTVDDARLDAERLARLRDSLTTAGCDAGVFLDPINIRYATGTRNMQVYSLHNPCRYVLVTVDGPVVLWDFKACEHLSIDKVNVDEVHTATPWYHFVSGSRVVEFARTWASAIADRLPAGARVAVDRLDPPGLDALRSLGVEVVDGQEVANRARAIKTPTEITAIRGAMAAADAAVAEMRAALRPGLTEQELWAELHRGSIARGGEWIETRLLTSGRRTNPWYQEASAKVIEPGDVVAFDTDLIGAGGYSVDISRTWVAGGEPDDELRRYYAAAYRQLHDNIALMRPGASFAEIAAGATLPDAELHSPANAAVGHGIGLCNEYPLILNRDHLARDGYDGVLEAGMVICVEALVAPDGADRAVKLEEQVLVTETSTVPLSATPYEIDWL